MPKEGIKDVKALKTLAGGGWCTRRTSITESEHLRASRPPHPALSPLRGGEGNSWHIRKIQPYG
ncbi:MAG: hypothetical protein C4567_07115 [Deltaproteobacteria bacterium]|nr:MAG: hypothetical protein C4567_07115 [Deltaproteobacteria bacterium]